MRHFFLAARYCKVQQAERKVPTRPCKNVQGTTRRRKREATTEALGMGKKARDHSRRISPTPGRIWSAWTRAARPRSEAVPQEFRTSGCTRRAKSYAKLTVYIF